MARPSLGEIYTRLRQVQGYHPMSATTFADWSMEAGDSIEIERDGRLYRTPVGSSTIRWNGSHSVNIRTDGNRERESVSRASVDKYTGAGAGGGGGTAGMRNSMGLYGYVENVEEETSTRFEQTDKAIEMEAKARTKQGEELSGRIDVEAGRISAVVTKNGTIRAGMIIEAINDQSVAKIMADKIVLSGNTTINDIFKVGSLGIFTTRPLLVGSDNPTSSVLLTTDGRVVASEVSVRGGGKLNVVDVQVSGNLMTITYANGSKVNFNKATTLRGQWSGGTFTVTAYQQGAKVNQFATSLMGTLYDVDFGSGYTGTGTIKATILDGTSQSMPIAVKTVSVNGYDAYMNGRNSVTPEQHTKHEPLYCSNVSPQGTTGYSVYTFTVRATNDRFVQGRTYDMWWS